MVKGTRFVLTASLALIGLGLGGAYAPHSAQPTGYFPPSLRDLSITCDEGGRTRRLPGMSEIEADWYPKHLLAADEPSLFEASQKAGASHLKTYRFTWLRTFHGPVIVRLDRDSEGGMRLIAKRLSGRGGYEPGAVNAEIRRRLTRQELVEFDHALAAANHLRLPPVDCRMGADGSRWIMEANDAGVYRYVNRWTPEDGAVRELGDMLLRFTGWDLDPRY